MGNLEYTTAEGSRTSPRTTWYTTLLPLVLLLLLLLSLSLVFLSLTMPSSLSLIYTLSLPSGGQNMEGSGTVWGGMSLGRLVGRILLKLCSDEKTTQGVTPFSPSLSFSIFLPFHSLLLIPSFRIVFTSTSPR